MKLDAPEAVAKSVWNAVAREADSIYPAGPERLFVLIQRLLPHLVDRSIAKQLPRVGGKLNASAKTTEQGGPMGHSCTGPPSRPPDSPC